MHIRLCSLMDQRQLDLIARIDVHGFDIIRYLLIERWGLGNTTSPVTPNIYSIAKFQPFNVDIVFVRLLLRCQFGSSERYIGAQTPNLDHDSRETPKLVCWMCICAYFGMHIWVDLAWTNTTKSTPLAEYLWYQIYRIRNISANIPYKHQIEIQANLHSIYPYVKKKNTWYVMIAQPSP